MANLIRFMDTSLSAILHFCETGMFLRASAFIFADHSVCYQKIFSAKPPPASRQASPYVIKAGSLLMTCAITVSWEYNLGEDKTLWISLSWLLMLFVIKKLSWYLYFITLLCTNLSRNWWLWKFLFTANLVISFLILFFSLVMFSQHVILLFTAEQIFRFKKRTQGKYWPIIRYYHKE